MHLFKQSCVLFEDFSQKDFKALALLLLGLQKIHITLLICV